MLSNPLRTPIQEREHMLHEILKMDIRGFRNVGHTDTGVYLQEPPRFYLELREVYKSLTNEQLKVLWLMRVHYFNKSVDKKKANQKLKIK